MRRQAANQSLDDVQVLGAWNFTLQGDTPLYWLRTGQLDKYLMKLRISSPSPCTAGFILHSEVDGPGTDGASFWCERKPPRAGGGEGSRRYLLAGEGLDSKAIVTRSFPDEGGEFTEEVEVLMEGYQGTIFLQDRKVQLRFRTKNSKGSIGFYNSTQGEKDEVHFSGIRITALRRGPIEVGGKLLQREGYLAEVDARSPSPQKRSTKGAAAQAHGGFNTGSQSTMVPDSSLARASSSATLGGAKSTQSALGNKGQLLPPGDATRSPMQLAGRRGAAPQQARFQLTSSASEGALRKSAGTSLFNGPGSGANTPSSNLRDGSRPGSRGVAGPKWLPLATNAPAGEQQLLMDVKRKPALSAKACTDFIPI